MRIVIPGGSGQVGHLLARHFHAQGHTITLFSRSSISSMPAPWSVLPWDGLTPGAWVEALEGADACINLAGRSVNCRYTAANRRAMYDSRILSTRLLNQVISTLHQPPRVWLNASTATIYRHALDRPMDEATGELGGGEPGAPRRWDFSIRIAKDWEEAFFATPTPATRKVALRSAVIFSPDRGGPFALLSRLVRLGLGGANGSGHQFVSWIHDADFVRAVDLLLTGDSSTTGDSWAGVVNLAAPHPLPNREFMRALRQAWAVPVGLPAAGWMIGAAALLLRTESELVLKSRRVVPGRLLHAGFQFRFPDWPAAARDLVARYPIVS
jgi:uncharacterized protein (TIGR01777 family)